MKSQHRHAPVPVNSRYSACTQRILSIWLTPTASLWQPLNKAELCLAMR